MWRSPFVKGRWARCATAAAAVLLLAACGGNSASSTGASKAAPAHVTISQAITSPAQAAIFVALDKGYFKQQNIDAKLVLLNTSTATGSALQSGSTQFVSSGTFDLGAAADKGLHWVSVDGIAGVTMELCVTKTFADSKHLTPSTPPRQIIAALKGGTLGTPNLSSGPALVFAYLAKKYGAALSQNSIKLEATGSVDAELTAMKRGEIDGTFQSSPACEQAQAGGYGVTLLEPGDVPGLGSIPLSSVFTTQAYANSHQSITTRVATAVAEGANFARTNTAGTLAILKKYYPSVTSDQLKTIYTKVVQPTIPKDAAQTRQGWQQVSQILVTGGSIHKPLNTKEGVLWTNKYVKLNK